MPKKIFILDTNVLIHNPQSLFSFAEHTVVIPIVVIEEIDQFKKGVDEKSRNARQIGRYLDSLRKLGSLQDGVPTEHGGTIKVTVNTDVTDTASKLFFLDRNDNLIIGTALYFKNMYPKDIVTLVSKDANVRIKADCVGLRAENYETDNVKFEEFYTGWEAHEVSSKAFNDLEQKGYLDNTFGELYPNEFVRITDKSDPDYSRNLRYNHIQKHLFPQRNYLGQEVFGIKSRNYEQEMALDLLLDDNIRLVSLSGKAGTGKTLLAMASGLQKVIEEKKYSRLVISRPISPLGKDLGYLPGSKAEKFNPWMQPIYDNMEILLSLHDDNNTGRGRKKTSLTDFLDFGFLELEPLTYIRGRSLPDQFIIIDEAQNLTPHEMKTIITRAGENTKIVLTGDPYQIDIPYLDSQSNGLSVAVESMKIESIVAHMTLSKGERSALADMAAKYL
ncbi:MAG TPA: PhoH family protein [Candidatus Cloacimonadota bacterium]|nr:PhoH family protein [Candidatus Cloacimonadota bacterium]HPS38918.1 PhoH family protein [Candidatus Cloacimonadota bacterium]